ncbi:MAG: helix-turn-helix transcriptional regulator [Anaerolineae bacterium]|nr:helix-turn-helix transcriptional regulator [Anaerolineae bacterium]MBT4309895.1 helix-turn-helix transcriptional regulator [Anaerolineae bacterium]MBT4457490.1 helix-turn-helix transcriptional regulator [Anaerolineae bacterium]MBT4843645.1 helix-turn-helix transcriptional regulator [Anaerolineae bacterium]MBT6060801.1 helix-turn-helix transcriptional regulator [Anaerolineae bacterium]
MNKVEARAHAEKMKQLRKEHSVTVKRTQVLLKKQKHIHREICKAIRDTPKTIPEIAEVMDMPSHEVLWHITALKKYDVVAEEGMCGEYVLYTRAEEKA